MAAATSGDFGPKDRIMYIKHMRPEFYEALEIYAPSVIDTGATAEELEELAKDFDPSYESESPSDIETLDGEKVVEAQATLTEPLAEAPEEPKKTKCKLAEEETQIAQRPAPSLSVPPAKKQQTTIIRPSFQPAGRAGLASWRGMSAHASRLFLFEDSSNVRQCYSIGGGKHTPTRTIPVPAHANRALCCPGENLPLWKIRSWQRSSTFRHW